MRDFRRAVDSDRDVDRPDSAADENRRVLPRPQALEDGKAAACQRADAREHDLAAVGMAGEHRRARRVPRLP